GTVEDTEAGNLEAHLRAAQEARHVGFAQEVARRVAVVAAGDVHQIFAALDRRIGGKRAGERPAPDERRGDGAPGTSVRQATSPCSEGSQSPDQKLRVNPQAGLKQVARPSECATGTAGRGRANAGAR